MSAGSPTATTARRRSPTSGFTLVELLVVIAVIIALLALIVPAFVQVNAGRAMAAAAYNISGALENARAYAKANNTYAWVGFYEEQATGSSGTAGVGRVIVFAVASKDATALYAGNDPDPAALPSAKLVPLGKPAKIDNVHLTMLDPGEVPARGKVTDATGTQANVIPAYQVGDASSGNGDNFTKRGSVTNRTTFTYPLGASSPTYTFVKVIQFNPLGDATKIVESPWPLIEIGLRPARGGTIDTSSKNCVAIQVDGIGGLVRIYRP